MHALGWILIFCWGSAFLLASISPAMRTGGPGNGALVACSLIFLICAGFGDAVVLAITTLTR